MIDNETRVRPISELIAWNKKKAMEMKEEGEEEEEREEERKEEKEGKRGIYSSLSLSLPCSSGEGEGGTRSGLRKHRSQTRTFFRNPNFLTNALFVLHAPQNIFPQFRQ